MSTLRVKRFCWSALLFLPLTSTRSAAADWPPITPEQMAMKDVPQQPGAPAVILDREEVDDDANNHLESFYIRIKILTEAGRVYADIHVPYDRRVGAITNVSGRTVHADGSVVPFDGKSYDKVIEKAHDVHYQVKSFTLPDVQVGSILDLRFNNRLEDRFGFSAAWLVQNDLFQKKVFFKFVPTHRFLMFAHDRVGKGLAWSSHLPKGYQPQVRDTAVVHAYEEAGHWFELEMTDVPAFVEEPYTPAADSLKWRVDFYYLLGDKEEEYWKNEGKYWNGDVDAFLGRKGGVAEAVAGTITAADSPKLKVRKIYAYVTQLENKSYIPFRAKQEEHVLGLKPNEGVDDVLRQRSGDHDELNRLFVAMVRSAGIPAWLMRVPDRSRLLFDRHLLSARQFEAELAIVLLDGKEVFLDPGTKFCPFGAMNWRYLESEGLRQSPTKGTEFGETPLPTYNQGMTQRIAHVKLTDEGKVEGTAMLAFYGLEAMDRRRKGGKTDAEGRKKLLEDEMKGLLLGPSEVTLTNAPDWDSTEGPLVAEFKINSPLATSAGKRWVVVPHLFQVNQKARFASAERANPVHFDYPSHEVDEVHLELAADMEIESLPQDDTAQLSSDALYKTEHKRESSNTILARRDLAMATMTFPADGYKELKAFCDKVKAGDDQPVILKAVAHEQAN